MTESSGKLWKFPGTEQECELGAIENGFSCADNRLEFLESKQACPLLNYVRGDRGFLAASFSRVKERGIFSHFPCRRMKRCSMVMQTCC